MKYVLIIVMLLININAHAGLYVITKHKFMSNDSEYQKTINILKFGYEFSLKDYEVFIELGGGEELDNGTSIGSGTFFKAYEIGFEKEFGKNFIFEAKWEADDISNSYLEHKIEIETKYNF